LIKLNCKRCNRFVLFPINKYTDGTFYCDKCYDDMMEVENNIVKKIISDKVTFKLMENFIDRYNGKYEKKNYDDIQRLLAKKYKIDIRDEILIDVIKCVEDEIKENRELRKFEIGLKYHKEKTFYCSKCKKEITRGEFNYSIDRYDKALCIKHQNWEKATIHAKKLYNALVKRGINCELECSDGHKSVDIGIPEAKINIELDGSQHITNAEQLLTDLKRDGYSQKNGISTIRIPNNFIINKLDKTADSIAEAVKKRIKELN